MPLRRSKLPIFLLEGINAYGTMFFFSYLQFLFRNEFNFGRRETLAAGAIHGLVYALCAWRGGRLAQRFGYLSALGVGFAVMLLSLSVAGFLPALWVQILAWQCWTVGMSLTWPPLEALACDGEDEQSLPHVIGVYNLVWAGASGLGYFTGGAIFDCLGSASLYYLPILFLVAQIVIVAHLLRLPKPIAPASAPVPQTAPQHHPEAAALQHPVSPEKFLKMAWLANPFAYVAINTLLLVIPDLAREFNLTTTQTGIFCSVWFFTRLAAFGVLWRWTAWHYRFRWLAGSFVALIAGFLLVLLAGNLWLIVLAQVLFGAATGLIYYSSLFYSMDVGEASQGEHGGLHEAAIGLGIFPIRLPEIPRHRHLGSGRVARRRLCRVALVPLEASDGKTMMPPD
jgi:predicted MFS family arabinose efflux permease